MSQEEFFFFFFKSFLINVWDLLVIQATVASLWFFVFILTLLCVYWGWCWLEWPNHGMEKSTNCPPTFPVNAGISPAEMRLAYLWHSYAINIFCFAFLTFWTVFAELIHKDIKLYICNVWKVMLVYNIVLFNSLIIIIKTKNHENLLLLLVLLLFHNNLS